MVPDPSTGFEYRGETINSRVRIQDSTTVAVGWPFPEATPASGPTVALLDTVSGLSTVSFALGIDATAFAGGEFSISYWLLENFDEVHANDVVAITDGITAGQGVFQDGTSSGAAGHDGFQEVLLNDWNTGALNGGQGPVANRAWVQFTHTIDAAFYAASGLIPSNNMRIIFRQQDNVTFEGNDGLAIDQIEIVDLNPVPGAGQAADALLASMDINSALNANCEAVAAGTNGPHFSDATFGGAFNLSISGEASQAILFMTGPLNPGSLPLGGAGQLDIGNSNPVPPFIPTGLQVLGNGTAPDFLNSLFNTGPTGTVVLSLPVNLPPGSAFAFQSLVFNSTPDVIKATNTVSVSIN
jgi:hypothetical protein